MPWSPWQVLESFEEVASDLGGFERQPAMQARAIADKAERALLQGPDQGFDMVRVNFANGDMVGHTGDLQASIAAVGRREREKGPGQRM